MASNCGERTSVGYFVGESLGDSVGAALGDSVGDIDGVRVGSAEGCTVGVTVGDCRKSKTHEEVRHRLIRG